MSSRVEVTSSCVAGEDDNNIHGSCEMICLTLQLLGPYQDVLVNVKVFKNYSRASDNSREWVIGYVDR